MCQLKTDKTKMLFAKFKRRYFFLLTLVFFSFALFLPFIGHGFIHDDFEHLGSVVFQTLDIGLTKATGGPFYAPIAWLSFKFDWFLWGSHNAFPFAMTNLTIHSANIILLYCFVERLWRDETAARWAVLGFFLLFPANIWAVMWIATRAHLLTTFFYLAGMLATLWLTRTERFKMVSALVIVIFATLALFTKESGITMFATVFLILIHKKTTGNIRGKLLPAMIVFVLGLLILFVFYFWMRMQSGAIPITIGENQWYSYTPSFSLIIRNIGSYGWRTYGILTLLVLGFCLSLKIGRHKLNFSLLTKSETLLSLTMFGLMIAPFIMLAGRSGIYTYLPGVAASILFGATLRSLNQSHQFLNSSIFSRIPIFVTVIIFISFTIGQSQKWLKMAQTNTEILDQIINLEPQMPKKTFVVLRYSEIDRINRFPDGLSKTSFSPALQLKFADPSLTGVFVKNDDKVVLPNLSSVREFAYTIENGRPKIMRITEFSSK